MKDDDDAVVVVMPCLEEHNSEMPGGGRRSSAMQCSPDKERPPLATAPFRLHSAIGGSWLQRPSSLVPSPVSLDNMARLLQYATPSSPNKNFQAKDMRQHTCGSSNG